MAKKAGNQAQQHVSTDATKKTTLFSEDSENTSENEELDKEVVRLEGALTTDSSVPPELDQAEIRDGTVEEGGVEEVEAMGDDRSEGPKEEPKGNTRVTLRNPYYTYENPTALIDHCYHSWRVCEGQWHRDAFYEKIILSNWTLSLNDVFAIGRLEPDFLWFLGVVRELIFNIKICDTKYIDGQYHGAEFNWDELEALLVAVACGKSTSREELDQFKRAIQFLPRPIMLKRIKRRAMRFGITDIPSALHALKAGVVDAKLARHFCFSFELDPDHRNYNESFARSTRIPE